MLGSNYIPTSTLSNQKALVTAVNFISNGYDMAERTLCLSYQWLAALGGVSPTTEISSSCDQFCDSQPLVIIQVFDP